MYLYTHRHICIYIYIYSSTECVSALNISSPPPKHCRSPRVHASGWCASSTSRLEQTLRRRGRSFAEFTPNDSRSLTSATVTASVRPGP